MPKLSQKLLQKLIRRKLHLGTQMAPIKFSQSAQMQKERRVEHVSVSYTIHVMPKMFTIQQIVKGKPF